MTRSSVASSLTARLHEGSLFPGNACEKDEESGVILGPFGFEYG